MGAITMGVICYIALIRPSPHLWFVSRQQRVDGEESADFQGGTIDAPLCVPLDCWDCSEKKRAHFLCEIDEENPVFARFCFKPRSQISTFGMYRVTPGYVSSLNRACFAPQKAMFRTSVRHVSQRWKLFPKRWAKRYCNKTLIDRQLQKLVKNRIFAPNIFPVQKKRVVFDIDCSDFWVTITPSSHLFRPSHSYPTCVR